MEQLRDQVIIVLDDLAVGTFVPESLRRRFLVLSSRLREQRVRREDESISDEILNALEEASVASWAPETNRRTYLLVSQKIREASITADSALDPKERG